MSFLASGSEETLVCTNCTSGTYKPSYSRDACTPCPQAQATTSALGGATSSADCRCPAGEYMLAPAERTDPQSWVCVACEETSENILCDVPRARHSTPHLSRSRAVSVPTRRLTLSIALQVPGLFLEDLVLATGYWRGHSRSTRIKPCPGMRAKSHGGGQPGATHGCGGGAALRDTCRYEEGSGYPPERETGAHCARETDSCKDGYDGPYCSTCVEGWYNAGGGECKECSGSWGGSRVVQGSIAMVIVGALVAGALLLWLAARRQLVLARAFDPSASEDDIAEAMRPMLRPALKRANLRWEDALPLIKQRMTRETMLQAMQAPNIACPSLA
jgi:hypothetical protein